MNLLIIDDDARYFKVLARFFRYHGINPEFSECPVKGVKMAKSLRPDFIVVDYVMPVMTGIDVMRELRTDATTAVIPFACLTGNPKGAREAMKEVFHEELCPIFSKCEDLDFLVEYIKAASTPWASFCPISAGPRVRT